MAEQSNYIAERVKGHIGASKFCHADWQTVAFSIPRNEIEKTFEDKELQYNGIYFLFGYKEGIEKVYVGQGKKRNSGESLLKRLREHDTSTEEPYRDKWEYVVAVTGLNNSWTEGQVSTLERVFYNMIPKERLLNDKVPRGDLSIDCEEKIRQVSAFLQKIGLETFTENSTTQELSIQEIKEESLKVEDIHCGTKDVPEIMTPHKIVGQMLDMLPDYVWNDKTTFLDMACKGGEFLREIYEHLMISEAVIAEHPNEIERTVHILTKQIYGVALSEESYKRTKENLFGLDYNIRYIENFIGRLRTNTGLGLNAIKDAFKIKAEGIEKDMKFNVIIGNPPYSEDNGGGKERQQSSIPVHALFVDCAFKLEPDILSYVMPCRWYTENDTYNTVIRQRLFNKNLVELHDYADSKDVFNGVDIVGGVCIFRYDFSREDENAFTNVYTHRKEECTVSEKEFNVNEIFYRNREMAGIISKIREHKEETLSTKVLTTAPFGFKRADKGSINSNDNNNIKLISANDITYVSMNDIKKNKEHVSKYNVCIGYTQAICNNDGLLSSLMILKPNEVCTLTYMVLDSFDTLEEAERCLTYIATKFARALIKEVTNTLGLTAKNFALVPLQNFTSTSEIDWNQSVSEIDKQLYEKYNLTPAEIEYIESTIRPMDLKATATQKLKLTRQDIEAFKLHEKLKQQEN